MKKTVPIIIALALAGTFPAATHATDGADAPKAKAPRSELIRRAQMRQFGGLVARPDSLRGKVVIANAGRASRRRSPQLRTRLQRASVFGSRQRTARDRLRQAPPPSCGNSARRPRCS